MKNLMKLALPMIVALLAAQSAFADCRTQYADKASHPGAAGSSITMTGLAVMSASPEVGPLAPVVGMAGAATTAWGSVSAVSPIEDAKKVIRLINEADVADGLVLRELAAETQTDVQALAQFIQEANQKNIFCSADANLYTFGEIVLFVQKAK